MNPAAGQPELQSWTTFPCTPLGIFHRIAAPPREAGSQHCQDRLLICEGQPLPSHRQRLSQGSAHARFPGYLTSSMG